jgi:D-threonate/D-erythronate kinase
MKSVRPGGSNIGSVGNVSQIVGIDTDTRGTGPEEAYRRMAQVIRQLPLVPNRLIYNKIDSTLRGQLNAEVQATLDHLPDSVAFIAPAYPAIGRTTRGGVQYLRGIPVHESEMRNDPKSPVRTSYIPDLFEAKCSLFSLDTIEAGICALNEAVEQAIREGWRHLVFDAENDGHMQTIAQLYDTFPQAVWTGSAGIAECLNLPFEPTIEYSMPVLDKPLLFLIGSLSESTRQQVEELSQPNVHKHLLSPVALLEAVQFGRIDSLLESIPQAYRAGNHCVVALEAGPEARDEAAKYAEKLGLPVAHVSNRLQEALGIAAQMLVGELQPQCMFLSGGDIARGVCKKLGITEMEIKCDIEPGIPIGFVPKSRLYLVTKAGAFGTSDTLNHIIKTLMGRVNNDV